MPAKRKIPTLAERVKDMPPAERKAYVETFWNNWYLPQLTKEKPARVKRFLRSRHQHLDLFDDLLRGFEWRALQDAHDLLLLVGSLGVRLPDHFRELQQIRRVPAGYDIVASILNTLKVAVEARNVEFFRDIASLLEGLPEKKNLGLFDEVEDANRDGRKLTTGEQGHGARSYVRRLIFVLLEIHIRCQQRLPRISELREAVIRLMPRPPGKQAFDNAVMAMGLAPPVLSE